MKGRLITFEGIEGAGKTIQVKKVADYLKRLGKNVVVTREPGGTVIGEVIRELILDDGRKGMIALSELFLFQAARAQLCREVILPALRAGKVVLSDRFADSSLAYQAGGRGLDFNLVGKLNKLSTSGLVPDLTILLDLPVEIALDRRKKTYKNDRLDGEGKGFYQKARQTYLKLARKEPRRWVIIDGRESIAEVREELIDILKQRKFI